MSETPQPDTADLDRLLDSLLREEHQSIRESAPTAPSYIGRYRIHQAVGQGGFGVVFLAYDEELARPVAIKIPHQDRFDSSSELDAFLEEARIVARLDHPAIVPVYDIGKTEDGRGYVVSKWLAGGTLRELLQTGQPRFVTTAEIVAVIADALAYTHGKALIHRDIKPANILLDRDRRAHLTDFGLALHEDHLSPAGKHAGTPAYMSPEQVRQEGHRIDGRSDIYSLGVVLYQMLTGRLPFTGNSVPEVLENISRGEFLPPRHIDPQIPAELERICLNALAKQVLDRYGTATELRDELLRFLATADAAGRSGAFDSRLDRRLTGSAQQALASTPGGQRATVTSVGNGGATHIPESAAQFYPKGLRAFDEEDADYFLALLPGPKDHQGLAVGVRFWKQRLEATEAAKTFPVGVMYGPSGCGKTSLMRAGILPRLRGNVEPIYLEASSEGTEARALAALAQAFPKLHAAESLAKALGQLRREQAGAAGRKAVLILDQFEQWLHTHPTATTADDLALALRQCDGVHVQCVLMVRDDFWLAMSRLMREIEVRLIEGTNSALIDLFDLDHARLVLTEFGKAYGRLPVRSQEQTRAQKRFLDEAVQSLSENGKVVCVRLSLFADLMKDKPWEQQTLRQYGGMHGVASAFLEEVFGERNASSRFRFHAPAARKVLSALMPDEGADIKRYSRAASDLAAAAGLTRKTAEFDELCRVLDGELRLITPVAGEPLLPAGTSRPEISGAGPELTAERSAHRETYYQLTHDYLVPALRSWLTSKKRETWRGRAELLLEETHRAWAPWRKTQLLPPLLAFLTILLGTSRGRWSSGQHEMMRFAARRHVRRLAVLAGAFLLLGVAAVQVREWVRAAAAQDLASGLLLAKDERAPQLLNEIDRRGYSAQVASMLKARENTIHGEDQQTMALLGRLRMEPTVAETLLPIMLATESEQRFFVILNELTARQALAPEPLWGLLADPAATLGPAVAEGVGNDTQRLALSARERFRVGVALAAIAADDPRWAQHAAPLAAAFLQLPLQNRDYWIDQLKPLQTWMTPAFAQALQDPASSTAAQELSAYVLAEFEAGKPDQLLGYLDWVEPGAFRPLMLALRNNREPALATLSRGLLELSPLPSGEEITDYSGVRRNCNRLAALYVLGDRGPWYAALLAAGPTQRTLMETRASEYGLELGELLEDVLAGRLVEKRQLASAYRTLAYAGKDRFAAAQIDRMLLACQTQLTGERDANLRAALLTLGSRWSDKSLLEYVQNLGAATTRPTATVLGAKALSAPVSWWDAGLAEAVILPAGAKFRCGSLANEPFRDDDETPRQIELGYAFALGTHEVSWQEYERFRQSTGAADLLALENGARYATLPHGPQINVNWQAAAAYCNWLSQQAGLAESEWCFERQAATEQLPVNEGRNALLYVPARNYLERQGYRLPLEYEWEYAARAGTLGMRHCGELSQVLDAFAVSERNAQGKTFPIGSKLPSEFGLFDILGNVSEWCIVHPPRVTVASAPVTSQEKPSEAVSPGDNDASAPGPGPLVIQATTEFPGTIPLLVLKGGEFMNDPTNIRSAERQEVLPEEFGPQSGFRIAKTLFLETSAP